MTEAKKDTRNIHERLLAVMGKVDYVQKDKKIDAGNRGYMVVTHDAVTAKVRPALVAEGVVYYPQNLKYEQDGNRTQVCLEIHFVNASDPTDRVAVPTFGYGIDSQDKGPGKAVSYAVKMALLKALGLETGEDADDNTNVEHIPARKNPPGRSKAVTDVRAAVREMHACGDADSLLAYINTDDFKRFAFKICRDFPNDWLGPEDNSGLSGSLAHVGIQLGCEAETTDYIARMESAARSKQQAAE